MKIGLLGLTTTCFNKGCEALTYSFLEIMKNYNESSFEFYFIEGFCFQEFKTGDLGRRLKEEKINTCIDTSGMFNITEDIKEVLKYTDLVLLDIKHIDDEKCKDLVGFSNKKELEFARYLSENNKKMWIRQVLVPGYTDDEKDLVKLKEFLATLKTVEKVQILKYHSMGKYKWEKLGQKYELEGVRDATLEDEERAKKILGIE